MKIEQEDKELREMLKRYGNLNMAKIGVIVVKGQERNYDNSLNADGFPMKPLKPATILAKMRIGVSEPAKPLIRSGILKTSNFYTVLSRNKVEISVRDYARKNITNNAILDIQKKLGRNPFGLNSQIDKEIDDEITEQLGR